MSSFFGRNGSDGTSDNIPLTSNPLTAYPRTTVPVDGDDEHSSLLGSTANPPTASTGFASSSWLSKSSSASVPSAASTTIPSYPSLEPVASTSYSNAREMTTFSATAPAPNAATYAYKAPVPAYASTSATPIASAVPAPMPSATNIPTTASRPVTQSSSSQQITVDASFIEELVAENTRLTNEVEDLRKIIQMQEQQLQERMSAMPARSSVPLYPQSPGVPLSSSAYNPSSGVTTINTVPPPQAGTKNVCCGHCRKWLLVPAEANLIFCPNCERVNNCSLR